MLINIRLYSQQLTEPTFDTPKEIVSWMGSYSSTKTTIWRNGQSSIRLKHVTDNIIEKAFQQEGEIFECTYCVLHGTLFMQKIYIGC